MTLLLLDGMEDASSFFSAPSSAFVTSGARNGSSATFVGTNGNLQFRIPAANESDTLTCGVAFKVPGTIVAGDIFKLYGDAASTWHTTCHLNANGSLDVRRSSTLLAGSASPAGTITPNVWYYIEFQAKMHDTTGYGIIRVNGVQVASVTNVDTKNLGTKTVYDTVRMETALTGSVFWMYDDLYVKSGAGETFLGDITVATLYPNGNGNANQWLGSDGNSTDNYLLVDEVPPNLSTNDYVKSSTVGQIDQYTLTDVTLTGTIVGVCHQATVALAAAGSQTFQLVNRRTTDNVSPTLTSTSTTYAGFHHVLELDPETGAAWTVANINALQTGVKVV